MDPPMEHVQKSYDQVADEYMSRFFHELEHKPLDRALLDCLAEEVRGLGLVADLGCGPGHVARYLHERGVSVLGIDLWCCHRRWWIIRPAPETACRAGIPFIHPA